MPKEESIAEIRDRYMDINSHAASYNWKALKSSLGSDQVGTHHKPALNASSELAGCPPHTSVDCGPLLFHACVIMFMNVQISLEEVNMNLTLEENGIGDGMNSDETGLSTAYSPVLCLYWCDDLTVA